MADMHIPEVFDVSYFVEETNVKFVCFALCSGIMDSGVKGKITVEGVTLAGSTEVFLASPAMLNEAGASAG